MDFEICRQLLELNGFRNIPIKSWQESYAKRVPVNGCSEASATRWDFAREFEGKQQQVSIFEPMVRRTISGLRVANTDPRQLAAIRYTNKLRIRNLQLDVPEEIIDILGLCP